MDQEQPATHGYDRAAEDVGNIVEFGHLNVRVPDQSLATLFYVTGLGLTRDPYLMTGTDNMWVNAGRAQFHLPSGAPQVARGVVGLVLPDLAALRRRLRRVAPKLAGTRFATGAEGEAVDVTCPWGNRYRCHAPAPEFGPVSLGIPYVLLDAPAGTAEGIARFYREVLGAPARVAGGGTEAHVAAGIGTALIYRETDLPLAAFDGFHIQISLADFSGPHRRLRERGLITEESDQHQYRFQSLADPATGAALVEVEHEVRSMRHPLFARPLVNRNPDVTNMRYAQGQEAWDWAMLPD